MRDSIQAEPGTREWVEEARSLFDRSLRDVENAIRDLVASDPTGTDAAKRRVINAVDVLASKLWLHRDANLTVSRMHVCPKCNGSGKMKHPTKVHEYTVQVPNDYMCGPCDPRTITERRQDPVIVECDLCEGFGKLKDAPVPITKVVGWAKVEEKAGAHVRTWKP